MTSLIRSNKRTYTRRNIQQHPLTTIPEDQSCSEWSLVLVVDAAPARPKSPRGDTKKRRRRAAHTKIDTTSSLDILYALIDKERKTHHLPRLVRSNELERLARAHATHMAQREVLFHSVATIAHLRTKLNSALVGENIQRGVGSCTSMHQTALSDFAVNRNNLLGAKFTAYGVAAVRANDGRLYMCQYFR
jgi:uncharacterized protein YkwD